VFAIKDAKKALAAACERLGYPKFSQRSMRQFLIGQWKAGIDRKLIAKWQGYRDGGKLIIDTYAGVRRRRFCVREATACQITLHRPGQNTIVHRAQSKSETERTDERKAEAESLEESEARLRAG
jgi:hypothetical protein